MMQYDYVVTLKRDKEKYIDLINIFLCVISILAFLFEQVQQQKFNLFFSLAAAILIAGLVINILVLRNKGKIIRYKNWLIIAGIFWIGMPYLQLALRDIFFSRFYRIPGKISVGNWFC